MGYIFDALNKQNGDTTEDTIPQDEVRKEASSAQAGPDNKKLGLAEVMANAPAEDDDNAPFSLADAQLSLNTNELGETVVGLHEGTGQAIATGSDQDNPFDDEPAAGEDDETADLSVDEPLKLITTTKKASWWSRLMGQHLRGMVDDRLVTMTSPASAMSEEYRSIRTSILARHDNERHLVHTITSATPQEGKTITCINLGLAFAELRNRKTIIIECDLRLPTFGKLLNCNTDRPGLIDYLRGDAKISDIIQQVEGSSLHIITAGGRVSDEAVQLVSSQRMSHLIQGLRAKYDHVIIDTPPVLQLADAGILGSQSEEVLVVARMRRTPRPLVEQAINTLTSYNAQVNGIIATDNPRSRGRGYGYKYGYRYGYAYGYTSDRQSRKSRKRDAA
ncbi:MAG: CpsD/CapB family tyrosine-protein kinase [Phycisphaeraceae bacterium]|nr:CpsD/CapB family tyrosine-protein kinase [Phycisphaeraceae bacterium]